MASAKVVNWGVMVNTSNSVDLLKDGAQKCKVIFHEAKALLQITFFVFCRRPIYEGLQSDSD